MASVWSDTMFQNKWCLIKTYCKLAIKYITIVTHFWSNSLCTVVITTFGRRNTAIVRKVVRNNYFLVKINTGNALTPIVTFSATAFNIFHRFLEFSSVGANESNRARSRFYSSAFLWPDTICHLVRFHGTATVGFNVIISVFFLFAIKARTAWRSPPAGFEISATFSCLCNIEHH